CSRSFSLSTPTPPPPPYTLSLHDALPIYGPDTDRRDAELRCAGRIRGCVGVEVRPERAVGANEDADRPGVPDVDRPEGERGRRRSEEHTSELQSRFDLVCRLLLEKKKYKR